MFFFSKKVCLNLAGVQCAALAGVDSPMAVVRATPAKRAREERPSLAPAPELTTAPDAMSATPPVDRRVRRRVMSSVAPDADAAAPAAAAQTQSIAGARAQISVPAAGPERHPLEAGREQPGAARPGQRRSGTASQIRHPGSQQVTRSASASGQPPTRLPPVQETVAQPRVHRRKPARIGSGPKAPMVQGVRAEWR